MSLKQELYYLQESVYFEPLFNQWYAWPYLIAPASASRHMVNNHRRIMNSFVNNYKLHIMAVNQPGMEGSEFLACGEEQVLDIKQLVNDIDNNQTDLNQLSQAIKELDELLRKHTTGESIEYLYEQVPELLQGYIEITMDMEHNPSYRIIESLFYKSKYYKPSLQSISFGSLYKVDERPFCMSTPRLADENHLQLKLDFNAADVKTLLSARDIPISLEKITTIFEKNQISGGLDYRDLFTTDKPKLSHVTVENGVRLQYVGHAGLLIESNQLSILIDPVIASCTEKNSAEIISFNQLPKKIDYICITHTHTDHLCLETLLQLRHKVGQIIVPKNNGGSIADPSIKLLLKQFEFNVIEVDDMEEIRLPEGKIISIPFLGEHGDINIRSKTAWFFDIQGKTIFAGADSSNLEPKMYQYIKEQIGRVDILAIGMECVGAPFTWIYGVLYTKLVTKKIKESRRLNGSDADKALKIIKIFKPEKVWLYALGLEPWYSYFMGIAYDENSEQIIQTDKLINACSNLNIPAERLYGKNEIILQ